MTASSPSPIDDMREVHCPRCGYDQRGAIVTWTETCPLEGTCTECGLTFRWCEVLRPEKFEPRWCVEFEPKTRRLPIAAIRTFIRSFWPWGFWTRLKMSDAIHWRRLAAYIVLLILPILLLYIGVQGWMATSARRAIEIQLAQSVPMRAATINNLQSAIQRYSRVPATGDTMQDAQVAAVIAGMNNEVTRLLMLGNATEHIDASWLATTCEALAMPLARTSSANIVDANGVPTWPYIAPIELLGVFMQRSNNWNASSWFEGLFLPVCWLAWAVAMWLLLPLSLALMPFSLRRAKVRWTHVARVTIYGMHIPLACVVLTALVLGPAYFFDNTRVLEGYSDAVRYVPWLAVALWWHAALSRYLKLPHAWLTVGMLTLMCMLILLALTAAIDQRLAWEMLDLFGPLIP